MKHTTACLLLALLTTQAVGQDTAGDAAEARMRQNYEALKQQELGLMQGCHTLYHAAGLVDDRVRRLMLGDGGFTAYDSGDAGFWKDYLAWRGVAVDESKARDLADTARARAQLGPEDGPEDGLFARTRQIETRCRQTQTGLQASACDEAPKDKAMYIPLRMLAVTKICREIAARDGRGKPAQWVKDDPEQLARFDRERRQDKRKVAHYDALLAGQPVPQCPNGVIGADVLPLFGSGGSEAFQPEFDMLHTEFGRWDVARRVAAGKYSPENDIKLSQMPYIRWQGECDRLDTLYGVPGP